MNSGENNLAGVPDEQRVNCYGCKHFFITWDKEFPYGCRKMEFRSKRLPSDDVIEADGQRCLAREENSGLPNKGQSRSHSRPDEAKPIKAKPRVGGSLNLKA
ncbi:MAG: hypothetical protein QNL95_05345 [OM182 bacterium]|jgi:hypothetical protein|nr:hypothetical protein [OM182 bacterium]